MTDSDTTRQNPQITDPPSARRPAALPAGLFTATATVTVLAALLGGCSGDTSEDSGSTPSGTTSSARNGRDGGPGGGMDLAAVQTCLTAAGIEFTLPSPGARQGTGTPPPRPSGSATGRPTGKPTGAPGEAAGGGDPDGRGGPGGGMGELFQREDVRTALTACGITVPTARSRPSGTPSPTKTS